MKLSKLLLLLALCPLVLPAQPFSGQKFIGGTFSVRSDSRSVPNQPQGSVVSILVSPRFGLMLGPKSALLIQPTFRYTETDLDDFFFDQKNTSNAYGLELAYRLYKPLGTGLGFTLEPYLGYEWEKGEQAVGVTVIRLLNVEANTLMVGARPGFYYFLSDRFALEAQVGALQYSFTDEQPVNPFEAPPAEETRFRFDLASQFFLGFSIYFGGGKN